MSRAEKENRTMVKQWIAGGLIAAALFSAAPAPAAAASNLVHSIVQGDET